MLTTTIGELKLSAQNRPASENRLSNGFPPDCLEVKQPVCLLISQAGRRSQTLR